MTQEIEAKMNLQLFADGTDSSAEFLKNNKVTTALYRKLLAQAVGKTGTISKITQMAFGDAGETDEQGNPAPPKETGDLNNVVLTKDLDTVYFSADNVVVFQATLEAGDAKATNINEIALIDEAGETAAKIRLLTSKGVDAETSLVFKWSLEF